jgi:hypothetical protein
LRRSASAIWLRARVSIQSNNPRGFLAIPLTHA